MQEPTTPNVLLPIQADQHCLPAPLDCLTQDSCMAQALLKNSSYVVKVWVAGSIYYVIASHGHASRCSEGQGVHAALNCVVGY